MDVLASAAWCALVGFDVSFIDFCLGGFLAIGNLGINICNSSVPQNCDRSDSFSEAFVAAINTGLANVGELGESSSPVINKLLGNVGGKCSSSSWCHEIPFLVANSKRPRISTVVRYNV